MVWNPPEDRVRNCELDHPLPFYDEKILQTLNYALIPIVSCLFLLGGITTLPNVAQSKPLKKITPSRVAHLKLLIKLRLFGAHFFIARGRPSKSK